MFKILVFLLSLPALTWAEEAKWCRYPAISPDGSSIAFSCLGDLWSVPTAGGEAKLLTRGEALETRPIFSPDGQWLAFASDLHGDLDIYSMPTSGGQTTRLTYHSADDRPFAISATNRLYFSSSRQDAVDCRLFPAGFLSEVYSISLEGGRPLMQWTTAAEELSIHEEGRILYEGIPALEDEFRKHHQSSAARDIWVRKPDGSHERLTHFAGEDREPVWMPDGSFCFLSERAGSLNIFQMQQGGSITQLSFHPTHPVRGLSVSASGLLAYSMHGSLFTLEPGHQPEAVRIEIAADRFTSHNEILELTKGASGARLSPDGREVAMVLRGDIFVCSVKHGTARRITDTPLQERNPVFSSDGRTICFAAERDGKWQLMETQIAKDTDLHFYCASELVERTLLVADWDCFQPSYSPDDQLVAYFASRCELRVLDLETMESRVLLPEDQGYSYSDGDQHMDWSPCGKWIAVHAPSPGRWMDDVYLIELATARCINASLSGYAAYNPVFTPDARAVLFMSNRQGLRSHGSWGGQEDIYALALNRDADQWFQLSEERFEELYGEDSSEDDDENADESDESKASKKKSKPSFLKKWMGKSEQADTNRVQLEEPGLDRRLHRLTLASASVSDFAWTPDAKTLLTLSRFEDGTDLWKTDWRSGETSRLAKLDLRGGSIEVDREGKFALVQGGGSLLKVDLDSGESEGINYSVDFNLHPKQEWQGLFDHIWWQVKEKFYDENLHGTNWDQLRIDYQSQMPWIDNKRDFADCMSELLGELNASHTGCFANPDVEGRDRTAYLGLLYDPYWDQAGLKVLEILPRGPFDRAGSAMQAGSIVTRIDGKEITATTNPWPLLNRKANAPLQIVFVDAKGKLHEETVRPVNSWPNYKLSYQRWVDRNAEEVRRLSDGRLGYVHVASMDDRSFRKLYHEALGRFSQCEGLVVDSRHNGGGWLTDDLVTFLSGRRTFRAMVRPGPRLIGEEPYKTWNHPSIVLMNESNYSDAHLFPFSYKDNGVGKLVGMPVAGTGTAVWWEGLMDGEVVFGIPEVGLLDESGHYLENNQLEPDLRVENLPVAVSKGQDAQLEAAVEELLGELGQ
jgi:tricorn protease